MPPPDPSDNKEIAGSEKPPAPSGPVEKIEIQPSSAGGVDVKGDVQKQKLGPTQRAGFRLAVKVGTLIGVVTILVVVQWWRSAPWTGVPPGFSDMKSADAKAIAENLKILSDASVDRSLKLFDDIVGRVLLPVFTSILGYIFGTRGGDSTNPPGSSKQTPNE